MKTGFYKLTYYKLVRRIKFKFPLVGRVAIDFRKEADTQFGRKAKQALTHGKIGKIEGIKFIKTNQS